MAAGCYLVVLASEPEDAGGPIFGAGIFRIFSIQRLGPHLWKRE